MKTHKEYISYYNKTDTIDNSIEEDSAVKVIVNPYNFNNKLITEDDVKKILLAYDINYDINDLSIYQKAFVHKSYSKRIHLISEKM